MASFDDYDEFGNYIGADLDSDDEEEEQVPQNQFIQQRSDVAPLEGYDDEPMPAAEENALMEIDGLWFLNYKHFLSRLQVLLMFMIRAFA